MWAGHSIQLILRILIRDHDQFSSAAVTEVLKLQKTQENKNVLVGWRAAGGRSGFKPMLGFVLLCYVTLPEQL